MAYIKPGMVISPKTSWRLTKVLYDGGDGNEGGWAAAEGQWDKGGRWEDVLALRWNGYSQSKLGNPQSRGLPTWFVVPPELEEAVRRSIERLQTNRSVTK